MARAHFVKKARKDNPAVKKGESYWYWQFRYGGKHYSAKQPRGSQLTQSAHYSSIRMLTETIEDYVGGVDELEGLRDELTEGLQERYDASEESRENLPENLQDAPTGELLQERMDTCEMAIDELGNTDLDFESELEAEDKPSDEEKAQEIQEWVDERTSEWMDAVSQCEV